MFHVSHVKKFIEDNRSRLSDPERLLTKAEEVADNRGLFSGNQLESVVDLHIIEEIGRLICTDAAYFKLSAEAIETE